MRTGGARAHIDGYEPVTIEHPQMLRGSSDVGLFAAVEPALFLVDGNNLLWRAAHGHPAPFTASDGSDLTALFRFFSLLRRALGTYGLFAECIVCFDGANGWGSRLAIDASYKANRTYDTERLSFMRWLPHVRAALESAGVASVELADHEADDVIATLAAQAGDRSVRILSTDRDYLQLVSSTVTVLNPRRQPRVVDVAWVVEHFGVEPRQWCDFRALAGDPSDGIPGVAGVGPKRAADLLRGGLTLDELRGAPSVEGGTLIEDHWDDLCRWRELIRLRTDVAVGVRPTGEPTPKLPSPTAVCRQLGEIP